jgi:hypothetical protein
MAIGTLGALPQSADRDRDLARRRKFATGGGPACTAKTPAFAFWGKDGRIVFAIAGGDPDRMPPPQGCIVTGILIGFGLRGTKDFVSSPDDYPQYLLLARALARCDNEAGQMGALQGAGKARRLH